MFDLFYLTLFMGDLDQIFYSLKGMNQKGLAIAALYNISQL